MPQPVPNPAPAVRLADIAALANVACTTMVEEGLQFLPGKLEKVPARGSAPAQVAIATFLIASKVGSVYLADIICKRGAAGVVSAYAFFRSKTGLGKPEAGIIKIANIKPAGGRLGYTISPLGLRSPLYNEIDKSLSLNATNGKALSSRMYPWRGSITPPQRQLLDYLDANTAAAKQSTLIVGESELYKTLFFKRIQRTPLRSVPGAPASPPPFQLLP